MLNQLKVQCINGKWLVSLSLGARAPEWCLQEAWWNNIVVECNRVCVADGIHAVSSHSGASGIIGLHAQFDSESKAKSAETQQTFRRCEKKVNDLLVTAKSNRSDDQASEQGQT